MIADLHGVIRSWEGAYFIRKQAYLTDLNTYFLHKSFEKI